MTTSGSPEPSNYDPQAYGSAGAPGGQTPGSYPPPPSAGSYPPPPAGGYPPAPPAGGYGQPGYGQPGHYAAAPGYPVGSAGARPGVVTAAGVMSYIIGGLSLLLGIPLLFGGGIIAGAGWLGGGGFVVLMAIVVIALGALHIWAGKMALDGKDFRILLVVSAISALVSLIQLFMDFRGNSLLSLAIPVIIIVLLLRPEATAWIKARGGQTFQN